MNKLKNEKLTFNEVWCKIIENSNEYAIKIPNDLRLLIDKTINEFNAKELKMQLFNPAEKDYYANLESGEYKVDDLYNDYVNSDYYKMDNSPKEKKDFFNNLKIFFTDENFNEKFRFYKKKMNENEFDNLLRNDANNWELAERHKKEYENIWWCKIKDN